jgi:glyoxylase-like metal-dependent hydrolase (beta-lactamase superfamily II)
MRRVILGFALLTSLGALYLVLNLFAAHVQVRGVAPGLPERISLGGAVKGSEGPVGLYYVNTASQRLSSEESLGHLAFILEWRDGRLLMIDSGMDSEEAIAFGRPLEWATGAEPSIPFGSVAEQMGEDVRLIDAVVFTHLHSDHTQGMLSLCDARMGKALRVLQTPWQADERNYTTDLGYQHVIDSGCARLERLAGGAIDFLPGFPGVVAIAAGGHTPGSTLYLARVGPRLWLFSGDITNSRAELLENRPKLLLYSLLVVPENRTRLGELRSWLRDLDRAPDLSVVVSHDLAALETERLPPWSPRTRSPDAAPGRIR